MLNLKKEIRRKRKELGLTQGELEERAKVYSKNNYGKYLKSILKEK